MPRLGLALLCAGLGACVSQQVALEGEDPQTFFGSVRGSWQLGASPVSDGRPPARQTFVELELSTSSSDFDQNVQPGTVVEIQGTDFVGPTGVHADFDLHMATLDGRMRLRSKDGIGMDLFGGLGFAALDLEVSDAGAAASDSLDGLGPHLGLGLFCELPPRVRLFIEASTLLPFVEGGDSLASVEVFDVGLSVRLARALGLSASWRHLSYEFEAVGQSDYDLDATGPRLTLELQL